MCHVYTWKEVKENTQNSLLKTLNKTKTTGNREILMVSDNKWEAEKNKNDNILQETTVSFD